MPQPDPLPRELTTQTSQQTDNEWQELFGVSIARKEQYRDYAVMEAESPIVCSALDAIADTAISGSEGEAEDVYQVQWDENQKDPPKGAEDLMEETEKTLQLKANARATIRDMAHKGDFFEEMVIDPSEMKIVELKPLPTESIVIVPSEQLQSEEDPPFLQYNVSGSVVAQFRAWQIVQYGFKASRLDLYGRSALYAARRKYRQLQMIEDGMVVNRLTRSTNRLLWQIPTGEAGINDSFKAAETFMAKRKRYRRFDPRTGKLIISRNPMDEESDLGIPTGTKIGQGNVSVLQGQQGMEKIDDVMFFVKQLIAALRTPAAYLGFEENTRDKNVITTIDVAFARMVRTYQKAYGIGIRQIYDSQFALQKMRPDTLNYSLVFPSIGTVDEMRRWQTELLKTQVAQVLKTTGLISDDEYLLRKVIEVEEDELKRILKRNEAAKAEAQASQQSNALFQSGLGAVNAMSKQAMAPPPQPGMKMGIGKMKEVHVTRSMSRAVDQVLSSPRMRRLLLEVGTFAQPLVISTPADTRQLVREVCAA